MSARLAVLAFCLALCASAQSTWTIDTFAGSVPGPDGDALDAFFSFPDDLEIDDQGNLYISDFEFHWVRQVTPGGQITNFAGDGTRGFGGDGGPASAAQVGGPRGVAVGSQGDVYFINVAGARIRRVDVAGTVTTFAGSGALDRNRVPNGEPALEYPFGSMRLLEYDKTRDVLYVYQNGRILLVEDGVVRHLAGDGTGGFIGDGGLPTEAQFSVFVSDMAVGPDGCVYVSDATNRRIRKISADRSTITTVAGNGDSNFLDIPTGTVATATGLPTTVSGLAFDSAGRLHFGSSASRVYRLEADGTLTLVVNLRDLAAGLPDINRMVFDANGNMFVLDTGNREVLRIPGSLDSAAPVAGGVNVRGNDGPALQARFHHPTDLAFDLAGNLIVAEDSNRSIRSISPTGQVAHLAGTGQNATVSSDNELQAQLTPIGLVRYVAVNPAGNPVFPQGVRIKEIFPDGVLRTLLRRQDNVRISVGDIEFGPDGLAYFVNRLDRTILRLEADGETLTPIAGNGGRTLDGIGGPATEASFSSIDDIAFDEGGNLYIAESRAWRILKINAADGVLTALTAEGPCCNTGDGGLASEAVAAPARIAVGPGPFPDLFFTTNGRTVRRIFTPAAAALSHDGRAQGIGPNALIERIAGNFFEGFSGDGGLATQAALNFPLGLAFGADGRLYIADSRNNRIRVLTQSATPSAEDDSVSNAANFVRGSAPGQISSLFGRSLAPSTVVNDQPTLPTTLGDVTIDVIDSAGASHRAQLFFVSAGQVNFLFPAGAAQGPATLRFARGGESIEIAIVVEAINPGLFSVNASGTGVGAIIALRVAADGTRSGVQVFEHDGTQFVGTPIDMGPPNDQIFLSLFGTGIRGKSESGPLRAIATVDAGGGFATVPVLGFAPSTEFVGLDQINIGPLPRGLVGRGEVGINLVVDGELTNMVTVTIQ